MSSQTKIKGKILDPYNKKNLEINLRIRAESETVIPVKIMEDTFFLEYEIDEPINSMLEIINKGKSKSVKILIDKTSTYNLDLVLEDENKYFNNKWYKIETQSSYYKVWREFYNEQNELYDQKREVLNTYEKNKISKKELDSQISKLDLKMNQAFKNLAQEHPDNYATPYIITGAPDFGVSYVPYFNLLSERIKKSYWGKKLKASLDRIKSDSVNVVNNSAPVLGNQFKVIDGNTIDGTNKRFTSQNLKSKLTLIDFWASWCGPCRKENIELGVLNKNYESEKFQIISFSLDTDKNQWQNASERDRISWINISDLNGTKSVVMNEFQIKQLPRNILLNSKGKIIALDKFGQNLKDFVNTYLSKNP